MSNLADSVQDGQNLKVSVRPEEFEIQRAAPGLTATVESCVFLGLSTHYFMRLDDGQRLEVIQYSDESSLFANGTQVVLTVKSSHINVFDYETEKTLIERADNS